MKRYTLPLAILLSALLCGGCNFLPQEEELPTPPVSRSHSAEEYDFAVVERGDLSKTEQLTCTLQPALTESLSFSISAPIEEVYVEYGDTVKKGQVLAKLSKEGLEEQISNQSFAVEEAELAIQHAKELRALEEKQLTLELEKLLDQNNSQAADNKQWEITQAAKAYEANLSSLESSLSLEKKKLAELQTEEASLRMVAGIDGVVTFLKRTEVGDLSHRGENFITISDMDSAPFVGSKADADRFQPGNRVEIVTRVATYTATVAETSQWKDGCPTFLVEEEMLPESKGGDIGTITLLLDERKNVLYLPEAAIRSANGESVVYILNEDGVKTMKTITTGLETRDGVEVVDGLAEGDYVVLN